MTANEKPATALLPLSTPLAAIGGSVVSALALMVLLPCAQAIADETLSTQIDHYVQQHMSQRLAEQAEHEGWQGMRFTLKNVTLPEDVPRQPCAQPLQVRDTDAKPLALNRQRLTLHCPDTSDWSLVVTTQANVFVQAVVATQVLERGQTITSTMLERQEVNLGKQRRGVIATVEQVAGLSAKRRIRPQQILSNDMLVSPWLVRRGDKVAVTAHHGDIHAAIEGVVMEDGRLGAVVRVKNPGSGKTINAKVTGPGEVSSTFNDAQN